MGEDVLLDGASFDSRSLDRNALFVPIVAVRDGHAFIADAVAAGATAYLTARGDDVTAGGRATAIVVPDPAQALLDLARWARRTFEGPVVAITGSVGKTTTKDLAVGAVGGAGLEVCANARSFNNDQGLPVTILGCPESAEVLIVEMGTRGPGEIARLCGVAEPTIGVVTAVADAHTHQLGGLDGVARAKSELVEALPASGTAVLNADDVRVAAMAERTDAAVVTFGSRAGAEVRSGPVRLDGRGRSHFFVDTPWGSTSVNLPVIGRQQVPNALAAIAVAGLCGVAAADAALGLETATVSAMRMEAHVTAAGGLVINDAYNANPTSMRAALDTVAEITATRRVAVLGEMAELDDPDRAHLAIADHVAGRGIELIAVGTDRYGVDPVTIEQAVEQVGTVLEGTVVVVKASRVAQLERVVEALVGPA